MMIEKLNMKKNLIKRIRNLALNLLPWLVCIILATSSIVNNMSAQDLPEPGTISMSLYFLNNEDQRLVPERRTVDFSGNIIDQIKITLIELIKGPLTGLAHTIPQGVELREVFLDEKGCAYVNFSRALSQNHPGGTTNEMITVASIVKTLTATFPKEVQKVQILIDNRESKSIAGHINISKPMLPF